MQNEWTREIERLTDLLKQSEEEMLFWRRDSRRLNKEIAALKAELTKLKASIRMIIKYMPEGFAMPLGWEELVAQVIKEVSHE